MSDTPLPFTWSPTPQRTIRLFDQAGSAPRGRIPATLPLRWPDKPAAATLDYTLDAADLLGEPTDALSMVLNSVEGLGVPVSMVQGGGVTLWISGGTAGADAMVDLTLTTLSGRRVHRIVRLLVV